MENNVDDMGSVKVDFTLTPVANPFTPRSGLPPRYLVGRDEQLVKFNQIIDRSLLDGYKDHFILLGEWGSGKTTLQKEFQNYAKFPTKKSLRQFTQNVGLYSQVGQELTDRLLDALKTKMRLKKTGVKGGFPRFKSFDRMKSLQYPQSGFKLGAKLKVTPFGEISIKQHCELKGEVKTLSLKREGSGKWYAIFTADEEVAPKKNIGKEVGIDLGLKSFATLSNREVVSNPRHLHKHEDKLAFLQRNLSRCKKGSKNRYKAKHKVALLHEKVANTRKDFLHKLSTTLTSRYSKIVMEDLAPKQMSEKSFGKSIHDAGWGMFANMIRYKAESAGCEAVFVDPKNTTKECSRCGTLSKKTLWDRIHDCPSCGYSADRDLNAAQVILKRATMGHIGCNACGAGT
jgi:putative transposase